MIASKLTAEGLRAAFISAELALHCVVREMKAAGLDGKDLYNSAKYKAADDKHRELWNEVWRRVRSCE